LTQIQFIWSRLVLAVQAVLHEQQRQVLVEILLFIP
jgi:hypothetical protein